MTILSKYIDPATKTVFVGKEDWAELNRQYDSDFIKGQLIEEIMAGNIGFPHLDITYKDAAESFKKLCDYKCKGFLQGPTMTNRRPLHRGNPCWKRRLKLLPPEREVRGQWSRRPFTPDLMEKRILHGLLSEGDMDAQDDNLEFQDNPFLNGYAKVLGIPVPSLNGEVHLREI